MDRPIIKLSEVGKNISAIVHDVVGCADFKLRLQELGFTPGCEIMLMSETLFGGPLSFRVRDAKIALRRQDADLVMVQPA